MRIIRALSLLLCLNFTACAHVNGRSPAQDETTPASSSPAGSGSYLSCGEGADLRDVKDFQCRMKLTMSNGKEFQAEFPTIGLRPCNVTDDTIRKIHSGQIMNLKAPSDPSSTTEARIDLYLWTNTPKQEARMEVFTRVKTCTTQMDPT